MLYFASIKLLKMYKWLTKNMTPFSDILLFADDIDILIKNKHNAILHLVLNKWFISTFVCYLK